MRLGTRQAVTSSTGAAVTWNDAVSHVQLLLANDRILLHANNVHSVFSSIVYLARRHAVDPHTPAGSIHEAQQLSAALPKLKLPQLVAKVLAANPSNSSGSRKWRDVEYTTLVGAGVASLHSLYLGVMTLAYPESGTPDTAQKAVAAAARDAVQSQLLRSGLFEQLATAYEQLASLLADPRQQQQQQVPAELLTMILGVNSTFVGLLRPQCENSTAALAQIAAQLGPVAVAAARLCTAVLQHPERVLWQEAGLTEFLVLTEVLMVHNLMQFLRDTGKWPYTGVGICPCIGQASAPLPLDWVIPME
jgi:hypothetical protein